MAEMRGELAFGETRGPITIDMGACLVEVPEMAFRYGLSLSLASRESMKTS